MTKSEIHARMDKIAGKLQDLDYLHEFTPAQQALFDRLTEELDSLEMQLLEAVA